MASVTVRYNPPVGILARKFRLPNVRVSSWYAPGRKSTVLLLHGNSSCKEIFRHQIGVIARSGFGVLAPDLPGHGESTNATDAKSVYSFPGYAHVVRKLLDLVGAREVDIFGWSLGGHIALELLSKDSRIRSVMLAGTPPVVLGPSALRDAFLPSPAMSLAGKRNFTPRDARMYGELMVGGREYLTDFLLRAIRRTDGNARFWMVRNGLAGRGADELRLVETGTKPLAIVHGLQDPFVSSHYLHIPQYRNLWMQEIQAIPEAGHAPHWQTPLKFNSILTAFLSDVEAMTHRQV